MKVSHYLFALLAMLVDGVTGLKKVECESDPTVCKDLVCILKPIARNFQLGTYGCTPVKPATKLFIRLTQWKKMHSNKFMPGMFDVSQNMCEVLDRKSTAHTFIKTFLDQVDPGRYEVYNRLLHPCPYSEKWSIQLNHSDKKATKNYFNIMLPGEYKTVTRIYNEKNLTFFQLSTFYNVLY